ncbi:hypothetical protein AKO1_009919 [Acrasis kona]|uniref:PD-(D/E)XK endonuclease-like domain-containing protein n=1 Tax=Acrasis kona TaxID=1008807 RepID=A0AAW2ZRF6_9EUKA
MLIFRKTPHKRVCSLFCSYSVSDVKPRKPYTRKVIVENVENVENVGVKKPRKPYTRRAKESTANSKLVQEEKLDTIKIKKPRKPYTRKASDEPYQLLSYSKIDSYMQCPYRFKLNYIDKVYAPPNLNMSFGSALHEGVAHFAELIRSDPTSFNRKFHHYTTDTRKKYEQVFDNLHKVHVKSGLANPTDLLEIKLKGEKLLQQYMSRERFAMLASIMSDQPEKTLQLSSLRQPAKIEETFKVTNTGVSVNGKEVSFRGAFDRIDDEKCIFDNKQLGTKSGDDYRVLIEYKTNLTKYSFDKHLLQLSLYCWSYDRLFAEEKPLRLCYLTSISTGHYEVVSVNKERNEELSLRVISETANSIASGTFEATPSQKKCRYCVFAKTCKFSMFK